MMEEGSGVGASERSARAVVVDVRPGPREPLGTAARRLRRCPLSRPAVRLPGRGALLLSPAPAGPAGVGGRALAALGAGSQRGDAAAREPDGRGALSRQARLLPAAAPLGHAGLRDRPRRPGVRGDGGVASRLGGLGHGVDPRRAGLCLRRAGPEPDEQRDLPGRRGLGAARVPRGRPMGPLPATLGVAGAWPWCWRCRCSGATRRRPT